MLLNPLTAPTTARGPAPTASREPTPGLLPGVAGPGPAQALPSPPAPPVPRSRAGAAMARVAALMRHNATLLLREPGPLLSRLIMPIVLITLMRPLYLDALAREGRQAGTAQVVTGMLVMFSLLALSIVGSAILTERSWHTWDRLRATPVGRAEMLFGKVMPSFTVLLLQQAVVLGFGMAAFGLRVPDPGLVALAVLAWGLCLLGIGATLGAVLRSQSELNVCYDVGGVALTALGGGLVPLSALPGWAHAVAPASPGYWAMSALRSALDGSTAATLRASAVLLLIAAATITLACWRINRGWTRSKHM
jgi:ABC-2 type transport system permease protein